MGAAAGRRGHLIDAGLAAAGLLYSGALAILSFEYSFEARVFALVAGLAGVATAIAYLIASLKDYFASPADAAATDDGRTASRRERFRLLVVSALILGSAAFLYAFGVYAFSFAFVVVFLRFFAHHSWRTVVAMGIGLTIFNYLMFSVLFDLRFDSVGVLLP